MRGFVVVRVLWRISNHDDLKGIGGERTNGRWHTAARGKRIVYLSEHPALALLEVLVNLKGNPRLFPDRYQLIKVVTGDNVSIDELSLSSDWKENPSAARLAGDSWLAEGRTALVTVPSAVCPEAANFLFNPLHSEAHGVVVEWVKWVEYDKRLFKAG